MLINMNKQEIDEQKRTINNIIKHHTEYLSQLEKMIPDEDKPPVKSWYTISIDGSKVNIDERLDARDYKSANKLFKEKYWYNADYAFEAPIWWLKIIQKSHPF